MSLTDKIIIEAKERRVLVYHGTDRSRFEDGKIELNPYARRTSDFNPLSVGIYFTDNYYNAKKYAPEEFITYGFTTQDDFGQNSWEAEGTYTKKEYARREENDRWVYDVMLGKPDQIKTFQDIYLNVEKESKDEAYLEKVMNMVVDMYWPRFSKSHPVKYPWKRVLELSRNYDKLYREHKKKLEEIEETYSDEPQPNPNFLVISAYLNLVDPYVIDTKGQAFNGLTMMSAYKEYKDNGHDGIILQNFRDPYLSDVYFIEDANKIEYVQFIGAGEKK